MNCARDWPAGTLWQMNRELLRHSRAQVFVRLCCPIVLLDAVQHAQHEQRHHQRTHHCVKYLDVLLPC